MAPRDIDQIHAGQTAFLRFNVFDQRTTPEFDGVVAHMAADASQDQRTGESYYSLRIRLTDEERHRGSAFKFVPGMSAEVYCRTTDRTPLSYLVKPLRDQTQRAFRER